VTVLPAPAPLVKAAPPQVVYAPQPAPLLAPPPAPLPQPRTSAGAPLVIDSGAAAAGAPPGGRAQSVVVPGQAISRVRASTFDNRSTTVPQGYLIPAVLETGFDSTRPGFARAVVSRDVRGFDGKHVLIPRGSRLIGDYRSEVGQAQRRAVITWTRLIRPDGMTIALDSPAVDTLGSGGVPASVNTHFFQRLGDSLLQSTFEIGRALAGRAVTGPVVVLSGTATASAGQIVPSTNYVPTLKVRPGKSISVFVAHDLDFSAAGTPK
jgi:type IV secretion system protein VirB10